MNYSPNCGPLMMDRRWKTNIETAPNCPRCASTNTKFCYYNNYSLSQPRYFCKGCRRYWTKGGSLRNVPFGGGCRKNRRGKSLRSSSDHLASSYSSSQPEANSSSDGSLDEKSGSDIDLADVFSKFLNPDSGSEIANYTTGSQLDQIIAAEDSILGMDFNEVSFHEPEFIDPGMDIGIDALLSDEISQDILWTDIPAVPNFSWQPPSPSPQQQVEEVQGYEGVVMDDHSMFHNNIFSGNWNSLDIPSYGA